MYSARFVSVACFGLVLTATSARADVELIAQGTIPGTARDLSGLKEMITPDCPHDRLGAFGSAIDYTGKDDLYWAVADRGPLDGASGYRCRMHLMRFRMTPGSDGKPGTIETEVLRTVMLTSESGLGLMGGTKYLNPMDGAASRRFDPEGARLARSGESIFLSDEYGPHIDEFALDGRRVRRIPIPGPAGIENHSADPALEMPPRNRSGRQPNRGFEGLAISPDGTTLWTLPQSPLIQDGGLDDKLDRAGINIRVVAIDLASGSTRQYLYMLGDKSLGVNEMLAVDDRRFLTIERDGKPGSEAKIKRIMLADFSEATEISGVEKLGKIGLPPGVTPARTETFIDLLEPRFGLAGKDFPAKIEAITFGPTLADGRRTLLVASDNDMKGEEATCVWVFAFGSAELPEKARERPLMNADGR